MRHVAVAYFKLLCGLSWPAVLLNNKGMACLRMPALTTIRPDEEIGLVQMEDYPSRVMSKPRGSE